MTCIVGYTNGDTVWIGGDSAATCGTRQNIMRGSKVFHRGPLLIGYSTSFRFGQLLQYKLEVPDHPSGMGDLEYMVSRLVDRVRCLCNDGGSATNDKGVETGGTALIGYRGNLFFLDCDYHVQESVAPYYACGCGSEIALGAMAAMNILKSDANPKARLLIALRASAVWDCAVRGPFTVKSQSVNA